MVSVEVFFKNIIWLMFRDIYFSVWIFIPLTFFKQNITEARNVAKMFSEQTTDIIS